MSWSPETSCGFESRKIKYLIPRYTRGIGLEIGCGMEKAYPHFIGVDNGHHFGTGAADIVADADDLSLFADASMDFVFSSHVLEHLADMGKTLAEWGRVIKPGGYLVLYVPSANLYPKCGEPGANPDHKHDIYPGDVCRLLDVSPYAWAQVIGEERGDEDEYSLFEVYQKLAVPNAVDTIVSPAMPPKVKTACVCRFGGFGDMLQTALVFPQLKKEGYHVTVMTTPAGQEIIRHDPHVDDWYIVDRDQVPNEELAYFWLVQSRRFDRFINLSESIEGTLLAMPGRIQHLWPHSVRKRVLNRNYHEWTCDLAEVPFNPCRLFYPSGEEQQKALRLKDAVTFLVYPKTFHDAPVHHRDILHPFNIVWALSGSSIHKWMPHQDAVIARILLEMPEARIFLVGNERCKYLEAGWQDEPRVVCLSGEISIRETLAMAQRADLVIGPETGVLNAVAFEEVNKIIFLSHSSPNNLTKHWTRTQTLVPDNTPCWPCHQLHYNYYFCPPDKETGAARCATNISPSSIYEAVAKVYRNWRRK